MPIFDLQNGYVPDDFATIIDNIRINYNEVFNNNLTQEEFRATNFYKFAYAISQKILQAEADTAAIFEKMKDFIEFTNKKINISIATYNGLIEKFATIGYKISIRKPTAALAGRVGICVDIDNNAEDYNDKKFEIIEILKDNTLAGLYFDGTEQGGIALDNGQFKVFAYFLPTRKRLFIKCTPYFRGGEIIYNQEKIKDLIMENFNKSYIFGEDFSPETILTTKDLNNSIKIDIEYSFDGESYTSDIYVSDFKDLLELNREDIVVVLE